MVEQRSRIDVDVGLAPGLRGSSARAAGNNAEADAMIAELSGSVARQLAALPKIR
jgi:hypothetical protein